MNMMQWIKTLMALVGGLAVFAPLPATAQVIGGFGRPPVNPIVRPAYSPYLNLLRGGDPAFNYYGLVRPQMDFMTNLQQLQQQSLLGQPTGPVDSAAVLLITGHRSQFMNFSHYYGQRIAGPGTLPPSTVPAATVPPVTVAPATVPFATIGVGTSIRR
jgi:hypothetical protein